MRLPGYSAERSLYQSRLHYSGAFNATTRPGVSLAVYRRPGYSSAREQCDLNCSKELFQALVMCPPPDFDPIESHWCNLDASHDSALCHYACRVSNPLSRSAA